GGTQQYMPPEQAAALAAVRGGRPVDAVVDARADIYALGMVLDELLGGEGPLARPVGGPYGLRHVNPQVTRGLADVLSKCLSPNTSNRYGDAQAVADDLRRHLANLPLRGVPNRSPLELWRKWRRRRPQSAIRGVSTAVACAALTAVVWLWAGQRVEQSQRALVVGQQLLDRRAFDEAIDRLQQALDALAPLPGETALKRTLRNRIDLARRAKLAHELHQFVERLRFIDGGAHVDAEAVRTADRACHTFWALRDRLLQADSQAAPHESTQVRADLLDLVVFWIDVQSRQMVDDETVTKRRASTLLDEAEATLGTSEVFRHERRFLSGGSDLLVGESGGDSPSISEQYALGRSYVRAGDDHRALDEFRRAVRNQPQEFWANYYRGRCAYRLERYEEALNAFCACVALAPAQAECFYNRALVYAALGQISEAVLDYDQALKLDPTLIAAATNRDALRRVKSE
ncbi:MAG TPA: protein kinase family protein, partial [Pirellulales bacterium]|nr:protein kinase family protein [Pirellulales bacterium]